MNVIRLDSLEELENVVQSDGLPTRSWLEKNFKSRSAAIRYLYLEKKADVKAISLRLGAEYRHVYNVVQQAKKQQLPEHTCPVCHNR